MLFISIFSTSLVKPACLRIKKCSTVYVRAFRLCQNLFSTYGSRTEFLHGIEWHRVVTTRLCYQPCNFTTRGMAGHSEWQNRKRIKDINHFKRSTLIANHCQMARRAIIEGGSTNPKLNSKLASVIQCAKQNNVPLGTIEATIKNCEKNPLQMYTMEVVGPGNSSLLLEMEVVHFSIAIREIKVACRRHGHSKIAPEGFCKSCFDYKGVVRVSDINLDNIKVDEDCAMEEAIHAGAEEVHALQDDEGGTYFEFTSEMKEFYKMKQYLEKKQHRILTAEFTYIPNRTVKLNQKEMESYHKLQDLLYAITDVKVVNVYDNIEIEEAEAS